MSRLPLRRNNTVKVEIRPNVEVHVSLLTITLDDNPYKYLEIREHIVDAEKYGHGLVLPLRSAAAVSAAISQVLSE